MHIFVSVFVILINASNRLEYNFKYNNLSESVKFYVTF